MYSRKAKGPPKPPRHVSKAGYRSKQKAQATLNKKFKTRSFAKCNRLARKSREQYSKQSRAKRKALERRSQA